MKTLFKGTGGKMHRFEHMGEILICPACQEEHPERSIRMHVYHKAKAEAFDEALEGNIPTPHLEIYKANTIETRKNRAWIN